MSYIYSLLLFFIVFLLQISFFGNLKFVGVIPNLILILIIFFSFYRGIKNTLIYVMVFGFLVDIVFGTFFGFHLIFLFMIAWIISRLSKEGRSISLSQILISIAVGSFGYSIFLGINLYFGEVALNLRIITILLGQIAINVLFGFFLFIPLDRYFNFLERIDSKSKQRVIV